MSLALFQIERYRVAAFQTPAVLRVAAAAGMSNKTHWNFNNKLHFAVYAIFKAAAGNLRPDGVLDTDVHTVVSFS